jgi:tetratricopeptide (TPR) repeat protein
LIGAHVMRAENTDAERRGRELAEVAERLGGRVFLATVNCLLGSVLWSRGELAQALRDLAAALEPEELPGPSIGIDPELTRLATLGSILALMGSVGEARKTYGQVFERARRLGSAFSLAHANYAAAQLAALVGDGLKTRRYCEQALAESSKDGFPAFVLGARFLHTWSLARSGLVSPSELETALEAYGSDGRRINRSFFLALITEEHLRRGAIREGLDLVHEALRFALESGERFYESELHRLEGELLRAESGRTPSGRERGNDSSASPCARAEDSFRRAIEVAARQGAALLELRATVSLGCHWEATGGRTDASTLLGPIYARCQVR